MQREGLCLLIFVHVHEVWVQFLERPRESERAGVSSGCQGACMVDEGRHHCRAEQAEHARGRRHAGVSSGGACPPPQGPVSLRQATCLGNCVGMCVCVREHVAVSNENKHKCVSARGSHPGGCEQPTRFEGSCGLPGLLVMPKDIFFTPGSII